MTDKAESGKKEFTLSTGKQSEPIQAATRLAGINTSGLTTAITPTASPDTKPEMGSRSTYSPGRLLGIDILASAMAIGFTLMILLELTPYL